MSLLWVTAAQDDWYLARNKGDLSTMHRHRDQVAQAHGVPGFRAGIALRPIYQTLSRSNIGEMKPTDAGFASNPKNDSQGNTAMPWSDEHPLNEHANWHDIPVTDVNLRQPIHATQDGVGARLVAHNLFHPGKLPPASFRPEDNRVGHPDQDPDAQDHGERAEAVGADEASKVPRFYRNKQGQMYVADGHHQTAANLLLGKSTMPGRVWDESNPPHTAKLAMTWRNENGEHHPVVHSVRHAGFAGYVDMSPEGREEWGMGNNEDDDEHDHFDENLYDDSSPEPTHEERAHYDKHDEYPSSFHDRHDEAYQKALQDKDRESTPDHEDDELMDFVGNHGTNKPFWHAHAKHEPVDITQPVYATQSHVSQTHLDKYKSNPNATTHQNNGLDNYLGDESPLMVTHNGRLHAIEGHHRVAAALQRGDSHIHAWHFNADEHGGLPDHEGHMPDHEDYEEHWSR